MAAILTPNEEAQLAQTIEMFEVITQSQPLDYQSLEILKEAYSKLGRQKDLLGVSKRIAEAYVHLGQLSSAILEYESILHQHPDDPDVQKALRDIESRANSFSAPRAPEAEPPEKGAASPLAKKPLNGQAPPTEVDDGKQSMQKLFADGKILTVEDFNIYWNTPSLTAPPKQASEPFILTLADKQVIPVEKSLRMLCEKARLSYLPIEKYDVDVDLARSFPRDVCLRWCVLPFDRMSKSVLVATANPFNKQAARDLESCTKNRILLYLASPSELMKTIKKVMR